MAVREAQPGPPCARLAPSPRRGLPLCAAGGTPIRPARPRLPRPTQPASPDLNPPSLLPAGHVLLPTLPPRRLLRGHPRVAVLRLSNACRFISSPASHLPLPTSPGSSRTALRPPPPRWSSGFPTIRASAGFPSSSLSDPCLHPTREQRSGPERGVRDRPWEDWLGLTPPGDPARAVRSPGARRPAGPCQLRVRLRSLSRKRNNLCCWRRRDPRARRWAGGVPLGHSRAHDKNKTRPTPGKRPGSAPRGSRCPGSREGWSPAGGRAGPGA